mmetsp:Transcript_71171/g.179766  ORF Transcript_71171/g.179766 Transcript_71171/m.179766 type:complete len:275 (+) Transcript_71171:1675-2499(+)
MRQRGRLDEVDLRNVEISRVQCEVKLGVLAALELECFAHVEVLAVDSQRCLLHKPHWTELPVVIQVEDLLLQWEWPQIQAGVLRNPPVILEIQRQHPLVHPRPKVGVGVHVVHVFEAHVSWARVSEICILRDVIVDSFLHAPHTGLRIVRQAHQCVQHDEHQCERQRFYRGFLVELVLDVPDDHVLRHPVVRHDCLDIHGVLLTPLLSLDPIERPVLPRLPLQQLLGELNLNFVVCGAVRVHHHAAGDIELWLRRLHVLGCGPARWQHDVSGGR